MAWWSKALDIISSPLSQPRTFFTKGPGAAAAKVKDTRKSISRGQTSGFKVIGTTLASTAVAAGAVLVASGASAGAAGIAARRVVFSSAPKFVRKAAPKVVRSVIPKTLRGKVFAGTATLIGAGILKDSPKARKAVGKTIVSLPKKPGKIVNFGGTIADVIEGKTVFTKENIIKGGKAAGAVGLLAGGAALIIPKILDRDKAPTLAEPVLPVAAVIAPEPPAASQLQKETAVGIPGAATPAQTVSVTPTKRKKRKTKKTTTPSMRQSVKVLVNTGRYLNQKNYRY